MGLGMGLLGLYALATAFPGQWWGMHHAAFLGRGEATLYFGLALLGLAMGTAFSDRIGMGLEQVKMGKKVAWIVPIAGGLLMAGVFSSQSLVYDYYGDAPKFAEAFEDAAATSAPVHSELIWDLNILHPKNGERTVLNSVRASAEFPGTNYREVFGRWNAIWGGIYAFAWLAFAMLYFEGGIGRLTFSILGLASPILYQFLDHVEIYAPSLAILVLLGGSVALYFKTRAKVYFWALFPLWFLAAKFHVTGFLWLPTIGLVLLDHFKPTKALAEKIMKPRSMALFVLLPLSVLGLLAYFVVFGDHNDPRNLTGNEDVLDRLFLPISKAEAPLDRYTLLGGSHLLDYFNLFFIWSGAALFSLFLLVLKFRRTAGFGSKGALALGVVLFLYATFFFAMNPLLSMPIDWDLFALPAPLLMVWVATLAQPLERSKAIGMLLGGVVAMAVMAIPFFRTHAVPESLSGHFVSMGSHVYKTYWIRSAGDIQAGWKVRNDLDAFLGEADNVLADLEPYALKGKDPEFANLNWFVGKHHGMMKQDPARALTYHQKALEYLPKGGYVLISLIETHFQLRDYAAAYQSSLLLLDSEYEVSERHLRIALHCALEAKMYPQATQHAAQLVRDFPVDDGIRDIYQNLLAGTNLDRLVSYFRAG